MTKPMFVIWSVIAMSLINAAAQSRPGPLMHTYSVVARDTETGEMGVAVQSHWFSVGTIVSWAEAGVGVIATQSLVNPAFGPEGLQYLKAGKKADEVLQLLIAGDDGRDYRQLAIVDAGGRVAAWTGAQCIACAGHNTGEGFSVQANMMLQATVWPAMHAAFQSARGSLAERMLTALEAAEAAGGDIRGRQSAALLVVRAQRTGRIWEDRLIDLRIEDHPEPVKELRRLLRVDQAYKHMNAGDLAIERRDEITALREYGLAEQLFPENLEMRYWHAVSLANIGKLDEAQRIFQEVFQRDNNWRILTERIQAVGLLNVNQQQLRVLTAGK